MSPVSHRIGGALGGDGKSYPEGALAESQALALLLLNLILSQPTATGASVTFRLLPAILALREALGEVEEAK